jgi:protein tyrosine phosphatase
MIWERRVAAIVMLTEVQENGVTKAHRYWPTKGAKLYGDITVILVSEELRHNGAYRVREFTVQRVCIQFVKLSDIKMKGNDKRTVIQYHYLVWPDHGVPSDPHPLLDMMNDMAIAHGNNDGAPILVHCRCVNYFYNNSAEKDSAGIGRTGTFILIHSTLSKMKLDQQFRLDTLNLQPLVSKLREQRPGCLTQYVSTDDIF